MRGGSTLKTPFLGGAYTARSKDLADQRCVNLYLEIVESKTGAEPGGFYGTPGLDLLTTLGTGPVRGLKAQEGTLYAVSGSGVYSITPSFTPTQIGSIATSAGPVAMIANPTQVAIFDGVGGNVISGGSVTPINLPFPNPGTAAYQDGFGVVNQTGSFVLWQSNLNDLTTWQPLKFDTADGSAEDVVAVADLHRQVVVLKEAHTEFWVNAGNPGFAFQRLEGVYPEIGCVAPYSAAKVGEELIWLSSNADGEGVVVAMGGYEPKRVSTHALETKIASFTTISDAIGYGYQQEGHLFYVLHFPTAGQTWSLDLSTTPRLGYPDWHQRAGFSNGSMTRHASNCFASFAGKLVVGDWQSGSLGAFDLDTYTDFGAARKWLRSWRALQQSTVETVRFNWLEIEMETGSNVPSGLKPQLQLRWTDDGHIWSNPRLAGAGPLGATTQRVKFNRLGMVRRGLSSDRIFELSSTDPFKVALLGAAIG